MTGLVLLSVTLITFSLPQWLAPTSAGAAAPGTLALCGNPGTAPAIEHVVVVMMENRSYSEVVGDSDAPYETALAKQCGNATADFGATHTSAANSLATSAGEYPLLEPPGCGDVAACSDSSNNLYNQLSPAGLGWRAFVESMPSPCDPTKSGNYKIGHNPVIFYTDISSAKCKADDIGVTNLAAESGAFWSELQGDTLPALSWITPDKADDGEGPGTSSENEQAADKWLQEFVATVEQSNSYSRGTLLSSSPTTKAQATTTRSARTAPTRAWTCPSWTILSAHQDSCHVPLFVVYPYTPSGDADGAFFDHYSITKTVESLFDLPYLAHAADSQTNSLVGHFGIKYGALSSSPASSSPAPDRLEAKGGRVDAVALACRRGPVLEDMAEVACRSAGSAPRCAP